MSRESTGTSRLEEAGADLLVSSFPTTRIHVVAAVNVALDEGARSSDVRP